MTGQMIQQPETGRVMEITEFDRVAERFDMSLRIAQAMAAASLLPEHLRTRRVKTSKGYVTEDLSREEVVSNCVLLVNQAFRWGVDPFSLPAESYVVGGRLGYQGKLVAAVVNRRGGLKRNLTYSFEGKGQELTVTVSGTFVNEQEPRTVKLRLADARTDNEIWRRDPEQKLIYSGSIRWARRHCPEVLLGVVAEDEADTTFEFLDAVAEPAAPRMETPQVRSEPPAITASPERTDADEQPPRVDINQIIAEYRAAIARADCRRILEVIVDDVKSDGSLPAPARQDLVRVARRHWDSLPAEELAVAAEPANGQ